MKFSEFLVQFRSEKGYTISKMAEHMGWTRMYYARFEQDKLIPTKANINKFAEATSTNVTVLEEYIEESINARFNK